MKIQLSHKFEDIVNIDNLLLAWKEFVKGKRNKRDVQEFEFKLMDNIISLYHDLVNFTYKHQYKTSKNNTKICWILKCDIRKFFASINHKILLDILEEYIPDKMIIWLLKEIINSFNKDTGTGLPLGNLTSQLFANIYMNNFDQFIKHDIKAKHYIRYSDDFVILSENKDYLTIIILKIKQFLENNLKLKIHPSKISIRVIYSGQDFLGWMNFPDHRILRTITKRRMLRRIKMNPTPETINSYLGLLEHGNNNKLKREILGPRYCIS